MFYGIFHLHLKMICRWSYTQTCTLNVHSKYPGYYPELSATTLQTECQAGGELLENLSLLSQLMDWSGGSQTDLDHSVPSASSSWLSRVLPSWNSWNIMRSNTVVLKSHKILWDSRWCCPTLVRFGCYRLGYHEILQGPISWYPEEQVGGASCEYATTSYGVTMHTFWAPELKGPKIH